MTIPQPKGSARVHFHRARWGIINGSVRIVSRIWIGQGNCRLQGLSMESKKVWPSTFVVSALLIARFLSYTEPSVAITGNR